MAWTGEGRDTIIWNDTLKTRTLKINDGSIDVTPTLDKHIVNKKYVDDNSGGIDTNTIVVLDGAVATLNGNVLILA